MSVIFVTDEKNMFHSPAIRQLVKRSGQEVPPLLEAMADLAIQASEVKPVLSGPHIKLTPSSMWTPACVPRFSSRMYSKLHLADTC